MLDEMEEVLRPYQGQKGALIPILQAVQEKFGYLYPEALREVARFLRTTENEVYGVATFYAQFRFSRPGEHNVRACLGTACHVRGGQLILEEAERWLGIQAGGTTPDYRFSLERVACFGSCALAPVVVVDKHVHGRMNPAKLRDLLKAAGATKAEAS